MEMIDGKQRAYHFSKGLDTSSTKVSRCIKDLSAIINKIIWISFESETANFLSINNQKVSAGNFQRIIYVRASFEKKKKKKKNRYMSTYQNSCSASSEAVLGIGLSYVDDVSFLPKAANGQRNTRDKKQSSDWRANNRSFTPRRVKDSSLFGYG